MDRAKRLPGRFSDFLPRQAIKVGQLDDLALNPRQGCQRVADLPVPEIRLFLLRAIRLRIRCLNGERLVAIRAAQRLWTDIGAAMSVYGQITRDSEQPAWECATPRVIGCGTLPNTPERLLQYIFGVFFTSRNPVANIKHGLCIQFIYPVMGITVACPATSNQIRMNVQTR
jgi:hypothetical protein